MGVCLAALVAFSVGEVAGCYVAAKPVGACRNRSVRWCFRGCVEPCVVGPVGGERKRHAVGVDRLVRPAPWVQ